MTHTVTIHSSDYGHLAAGLKHFVLLPDTSPPLHTSDVLHLTSSAHPTPLVRRVTYILSGVGLEKDWLCAEVWP